MPETMTAEHTQQFDLTPDNPIQLSNLCGLFNRNLKQIEDSFDITIQNRGNQFFLKGDKSSIHSATSVLKKLYTETGLETEISAEIVHLFIQAEEVERFTQNNKPSEALVLKTPQHIIKPRGNNQKNYVKMIQSHDINFGIGPAGTGKTYLAVACAVSALHQDLVKRILLVRPAVEAGEKLGFLPGDLSQKIDPYLRPLYDALHEMIGAEQVARLIEKNIIEVAPLAYMRGRTLSNSFIILDESQNTTRAQMKMFLTRIGFGSTAVITGDISQIDLPHGSQSGLVHILSVLKNVKGLGFTEFSSNDVVRHPLVQRIVEAYDKHEQYETDKRSNKTHSE